VHHRGGIARGLRHRDNLQRVRPRRQGIVAQGLGAGLARRRRDLLALWIQEVEVEIGAALPVEARDDAPGSRDVEELQARALREPQDKLGAGGGGCPLGGALEQVEVRPNPPACP